MSRTDEPDAATPVPDRPAPDGRPDETPPVDDEAVQPIVPDLATLPIAGITRRRLGFLVGSFIAVWVVILFARQVGEASAATARADAIAEANEALATEIAALEAELELIQTAPYIEQQARAYGLGEPGEIPFSLAPGAPPLPPDAPGSAAVRLGAGEAPPTPLESWLSLLFGPER